MHVHPSPPTVLAKSPTSHLLLSASANPPVVRLQNLTHGTSPLLLHPSASNTAVTLASFHPERTNIFLLGFIDGTIAAYDATAVFRDDSMKLSAETAKSGRMGEISHLKSLHRVVARQDANAASSSCPDLLGTFETNYRSESITAAAFMPSHKTRAVSVGADGKCRLLDFRGGVTILRTWKLGAPASCLSILPLKSSRSARGGSQNGSSSQPGRVQSNKTTHHRGIAAEEMPTDNVLAIGRIDGRIMIFDSIGSLLVEKNVDPRGSRIIEVSWMEGPAPEPLSSPHDVPKFSEPCENVLELDIDELRPGLSKHHPSKSSLAGNKRKRSTFMLPVDGSFSGHEESGSAKRQSGSTVIGNTAAEAQTHDYMDLFSPVKGRPQDEPHKSVGEGVGTPRKRDIALQQIRPERASSNLLSPNKIQPSASQLNGFSHTYMPEDAPFEKDEGTTCIQFNAKCQSPIANKSFRRVAGPYSKEGSSLDSSSSVAFSESSAKSSDHSNILADLKRIGDQDGHKRSGIALFAPYLKPAPKPAASKTRTNEDNNTVRNSEYKSVDRSENSEDTKSEPPSDESWRNDISNSDIWLDTSSPIKPARSRRRVPPIDSDLHQIVDSSLIELHRTSSSHCFDRKSTNLRTIESFNSTNFEFAHPSKASTTNVQLHSRSSRSNDQLNHPMSDHETNTFPLPPGPYNSASTIRDFDSCADVSPNFQCQDTLEPSSPRSRRPTSVDKDLPPLSPGPKTQGRRCSLKRLLSPHRRREHAVAQQCAEVVETEESVIAETDHTERKGMRALTDITGNETKRATRGKDTLVSVELGAEIAAQKKENPGVEGGKQDTEVRMGVDDRQRKGGAEHNDVQLEHHCACAEYPDLRRELQELKHEMAQLRREVLAMKRRDR